MERFISQYKHHLEHHSFGDFDEYCLLALKKYSVAIGRNTQWFSPEKNLSQSFYYEAIKKYVKCFGKKNILIVAFEYFTTGKLLDKLQEFLGLPFDQDHVPKINVSKKNTCMISQQVK